MKELYKKLLKVQEELKPIVKDETNPHFKNTYFDINSLIAVLRPVITKHGLVVIQPIIYAEGKNALSTEVMDAESGDRLVSTISLPETSDAQKLGAVITYYRRYALTSLFLLEAEDDNGNTAAQKPAAKAYTAPVAQSNAAKCAKCGAGMKTSQAGKAYCEKLCWKNPAPQAEEIRLEDVPF